ncbi:MAG TPA: carboxypeptidase regulatory-like domain-containing protein [Nitrospiria bacterium]|nr:carboxypeptidase regulatory-like domain-containing protein [Nitrospiria bacterium]
MFLIGNSLDSPPARNLVTIGLVLAIWLLLFALGNWAAAQTGGSPKYKEVQVSSGGTISGTITYKGPIPEPYVIWPTKDVEIFGKTIPDERLLISKEGKIKNVVISLDGIKDGKRWANINASLVNQRGQFIPHVQVVRTGAQLEIINQDPVLHNTHGFQGGRTVFNPGLPTQGQKVKKSLKQAGIIQVMCDVHDWMNGWIVVQDHPYFAVTGEDGNFTIADIPPGTYKILAWHEKLGKKQAQVKVVANGKTRLDFTFSASDR